jgi:membrane peptidoglycan carboxypeptidase
LLPDIPSRAAEPPSSPPLGPRPTRELPAAAATSSGPSPAAQRTINTLEPRDRTWVAVAEPEVERPTGAVTWSGESPQYFQPRPVPRTGIAARPTQRYRRRRRYMRYVRRSARARQTERGFSLTRVLWAGMVVSAALLATLITGSVSAAAAYYATRAGDITELTHTIASKDSLHIYDANGTLLYESADHGVQSSIPLAKMPVELINATIATEDNTFWTNDGVNFPSMVRAAYSDLLHQGITQGGSTITQQLIKYNLLNSNDTFDRKVKEAILAFGMTTQGVYTKSQILEMYLNTIPYGREAYGIDAAAHSYFSYDDDLATGTTAAQHLDLAQAAMLAGIPQNPNQNNPLLHPEHGHSRQSDVLQAMVADGYITQRQADAAYAEAGQPDFFHPAPPPTNLAPHFSQYIIDQLQQMVLSGQLGPLSRSGLNIYTTLDLDLQNHVQDAMRQHLYGDDRDDYVGHHFIRDDHVTNSAAILVDHHTGAIKVLLGSIDFNNDSIDGQVNVVNDGYRGPGSAFKPIVYATAFEKGWFPAMVVSDTPTIFYDAGGDTTYKPLNFNIHQFNQEVTLRKALQFSLNIPAVKVMTYAGVSDVQANAQRWGIQDWKGTWGLSSVLGSLDVTLYDMAQVYTVFANDGMYVPLRAINSITDGSGNVIFQYHQPRPIQVMPPQVAFLITNILSDNPARAGDFGACSPLYLDPDPADCAAYQGNSPNAWPAAAKTGTGQDFRDDYTLGYTSDYTMGVWAGNTDHTPMIRIDGITGAAPIFYHSMLYAERNLPKTPFPVPAGVHQGTFTSNGITSTDWFIDGNTLPDNVGSGGPSYIPCLIYHTDETNPWDFCPPGSGGASQPPAGTVPG